MKSGSEPRFASEQGPKRPSPGARIHRTSPPADSAERTGRTRAGTGAERTRQVETGTYRETQDPFRRTDALGRNPLFEAHSNEAIRIFIQAGCDPLERPRSEERATPESQENEQANPNALELLTVRPLKPRGQDEREMSPAALRSRALKTMSTAIPGRTFQQLLREDPLLAGGCSPAAQAKNPLETEMTQAAAPAAREPTERMSHPGMRA